MFMCFRKNNYSNKLDFWDTLLANVSQEQECPTVTKMKTSYIITSSRIANAL